MLEHADVPFLQRIEWLTEIELSMRVVRRPASWLASSRTQLGQQGQGRVKLACCCHDHEVLCWSYMLCGQL